MATDARTLIEQLLRARSAPQPPSEQRRRLELAEACDSYTRPGSVSVRLA